MTCKMNRMSSFEYGNRLKDKVPAVSAPFWTLFTGTDSPVENVGPSGSSDNVSNIAQPISGSCVDKECSRQANTNFDIHQGVVNRTPLML